jgi:hypothetical protein
MRASGARAISASTRACTVKNDQFPWPRTISPRLRQPALHWLSPSAGTLRWPDAASGKGFAYVAVDGRRGRDDHERSASSVADQVVCAASSAGRPATGRCRSPLFASAVHASPRPVEAAGRVQFGPQDPGQLVEDLRLLPTCQASPAGLPGAEPSSGPPRPPPRATAGASVSEESDEMELHQVAAGALHRPVTFARPSGLPKNRYGRASRPPLWHDGRAADGCRSRWRRAARSGRPRRERVGNPAPEPRALARPGRQRDSPRP